MNNKIEKKIGILTIHGVGSQEPAFSKKFENAVNRKLGSKAGNFVWQEIYWAEALKEREDHLWESMSKARLGNRPFPLDWHNLRQFVIHNVGDALAYHSDVYQEINKATSARYLIHQIVSASVGLLQGKLKSETGSPIVIIAHSMGATIMSDYIWDCQNPPQGHKWKGIPTHVGFITFGCNIPIFSLTYKGAVPIRFPGNVIRYGKNEKLLEKARWLNFLDRDDILGWPLKAFYQNTKPNPMPKNYPHATVRRIVDREIDVGSLFTSWNPMSHEKYWTDNDFIKPVAEYLNDLLTAF